VIDSTVVGSTVVDSKLVDSTDPPRHLPLGKMACQAACRKIDALKKGF
jgi:hypothetical protein